jgi:hypothetical protein
MRITIAGQAKTRRSYAIFAGALLVSAGVAGPVWAGTAYIDQPIALRNGVQYSIPVVGQPAPQAGTAVPRGYQNVSPGVTPELVSAGARGGNYAVTTQIGNYNYVFQGQSGNNNLSNVGIIGGNHNTVGVLQRGYSLLSNLMLINTSGLFVGVIQPPGSRPVNALIARLPNGGLLIKR